MIFACGTCGISALSSSFPPFHDWTYLLLVAFVLYNIVLIREGGTVSGTLSKSIATAFGLFFLSAFMFAGLVWPVLILAVLFFFLKRLAARDKITLYLSIGLLALFTLSGVWRFVQAKEQGKYWQLSRLKAGGPGQGYFAKAARERIFSDEDLAKYLMSENRNEARNAGEILKRRIQAIDSLQELFVLEQALGNSLQESKHSEIRKTLERLRKSLESKESEAPEASEADS